MNKEKCGGKILAGENSLFVHQSYLTILVVESSNSKLGGKLKKNF
jgi:hypothetical protein